MRFDLSLAVFSSGLWAPLALMAFGIVLAVGGVIFLWQRRKKPARRAPEVQETDEVQETEEAIDEPTELVGEEAAAPAQATAPSAAGGAASTGRRRRSLVGGAERDDGTPSGELQPEEDAAEDYATAEKSIEADGIGEPDEPIDLDGSVELEEPIIEEAEFSDYPDEDDFAEELDDEHLEVLEPEEVEAELDPEWIEATEEPSDLGLTGAGAAAAGTALTAGTAGAAAALAASASGDDNQLEDEFELVEEAIDEKPENIAPSLTAPSIDSQPREPVTAEVMAALKRPIVFRQFLPQTPGKDGLSFYGGQPIGPADFQWPRERGSEGGAPLQFVMQWDCSQLADVDPTGLLPQDGVLYCFVNCERGPDEDYLASHTFLHLRGSVQAWAPIAIPDDAGPALGRMGAFKLSGCTDAVDGAEDFVPRALPRFPFAPVTLSHTISEESGVVFWSDEEAAAALLDAQKSGISVREEVNSSAEDYQDMGRPFSAFPHDFGAIRVLAARMIEALENPDEFLAETLYPSLTASERSDQFVGWGGEAKEIYLLGTQRSPGQKLDQNIADDIWHWFEERKGVLDTRFPDLVEETVDLSLSVNSEALSNVPANWIDQAMHAHALATEYEAENASENGSRIRAVTPARMFGPAKAAPAIVDLAHDHVLLLELPDGAGPGHHFGGRTLQYWITTDDLAAGKFDAVKSVILEPAA